MRRDKPLMVSIGLTVLCAVVAAWLFTLDVYVDERNVDGVPAFCGSAYDVALIKRNGDMGGEMPSNQAAIGRAASQRPGWTLLLASLAAVVGLSVACYAVLRFARTSSRRDGGVASPR